MNKTNHVSKLLSVIICLMLTAAMALTMTACGDTTANSEPATGSSQTSSDGVLTVGEGKTEFGFTVTDLDGNKTEFTVCTDKTTVGEALLDAKLIEGDDSEYGLYVKNVNGITADFDTDGTYWAFYIDGEYAMTGVDSTEITDGANYEFRISK